MTPYSRLKLYDIFTLYQTKLLENHTLCRKLYLYSLYERIHSPPPGIFSLSCSLSPANNMFQYILLSYKLE